MLHHGPATKIPHLKPQRVEQCVMLNHEVKAIKILSLIPCKRFETKRSVLIKDKTLTGQDSLL